MQLKPKLKRQIYDEDQADKAACCARCGSQGWCSPKSGQCYPLQHKIYYEPCEAHPEDHVILGDLDWFDEFNGPEIDKSSWALLEGESSENTRTKTLQKHTRENAFVANGTLKIVAKCQDLGSWKYSSARLTTLNLRDWGPGHRFEIKARAPTGRGSWPAIWMLPSRGQGKWPHSGEIDILETAGCMSGKVHGAVHTGAFNQGTNSTKGHHFHTDLSDWHTYTFDWMPARMRWYVDGLNFFTFAPDATKKDEWPFGDKFYLNMNVGVAGAWAGFCLEASPSCEKLDEFGQDQVLELDYVRVFKLDQEKAG